MSPSSIPLSDLESGNAAKFENLGDKYAGKITDLDERQQTDMDGSPAVFPDGSPRMVWVITIQPETGDAVQLWAKGGKYKATEGHGDSMLAAIGQAVRQVNADAVDVGGYLAVAYTGIGEAKKGKAKLYTAQYKPPAPPSIPADDMFSDS